MPLTRWHILAGNLSGSRGGESHADPKDCERRPERQRRAVPLALADRVVGVLGFRFARRELEEDERAL